MPPSTSDKGERSTEDLKLIKRENLNWSSAPLSNESPYRKSRVRKVNFVQFNISKQIYDNNVYGEISTLLTRTL